FTGSPRQADSARAKGAADSHGGGEQLGYWFTTQDQFPHGRIPSSQLYAEVGPEQPPRPHPLCTAAREPTEGRAEVCQETQITNQEHRDETKESGVPAGVRRGGQY